MSDNGYCIKGDDCNWQCNRAACGHYVPRGHAGNCYPDCGCADNDFDWDDFAAAINGTDPEATR